MKRIALCLPVLLTVSVLHAQGTAITPSRPTHYFYTPTPYVNDPYHLVVSLHEISFSFPANLQLQASLFDNIGRINFGAKYGFTDYLSLGAGLAHTLVHIGRGSHGIPNEATPRLGVFLSWGFLLLPAIEAVLVPHSQIGERVSIGTDIGFMGTPSEFWSVIWEIGSSVDLEDQLLYLNTDAGIRIHPPAIPFMRFDLGVDLEEFPVREGVRPTATVYFDVIFSMVVR